VTIIPAGTSFEWTELERPPGDTAPPGLETILFRSEDRRFSCGFWKRVPETGSLAPPFDEIMMILEGEVGVSRADGTVLKVGGGDVLAAPNGSRSTWHSLSPVYKFWAVHHGAAEGREPEALLGNDALEGSTIAFASADGAFSAGLHDGDSFVLEREHDAAALILEGPVRVTTETSVIHAEAGDVVISPRGTAGRWSRDGNARVFWATYRP
jgi:uncharacterized cupin superfamily protein